MCVTFFNFVLRYRAKAFPSRALAEILDPQDMRIAAPAVFRARPDMRGIRPGYEYVSKGSHPGPVPTTPLAAGGNTALGQFKAGVRFFQKEKSSGARELAAGHGGFHEKARETSSRIRKVLFYCFGFLPAGFLAGLSACLPPLMASRAALASGMPLAAALVNSSLAFFLSCFTPTPFR